MRTQDEPSLQNHTTVGEAAPKVMLGRSILTLLGILAAIAACVWIGIAVYGVTKGT